MSRNDDLREAFPSFAGEYKAAQDRILAKRAAARRALVDNMIADVKEGILVLASVYGLPVTEEMASDRANNIVCQLINNYKMEPLP